MKTRKELLVECVDSRIAEVREAYGSAIYYGTCRSRTEDEWAEEFEALRQLRLEVQNGN